MTQKTQNKLCLDSGLSEESFAKTKFSLLLNEKGFLVKKSSDSTWDNFSAWQFDEIKTMGDSVFFCGDFEGVPVQSILDSDKAGRKNLVFAVCSAYFYSLQKNVNLPSSGPEGIFYDSEKEELLFLPEKTFDKAFANRGKEIYLKNQDAWRDMLLSGDKARAFSLGLYSYYAVTGTLPFRENEDNKISDRNFLPVEFAVNGINHELAESIDRCLSEDSSVSFSDFPLSELQKEIFNKESQKHQEEEKIFSKKREDFIRERQFKLKTGRFIRRNIAKAGAILAFLLFTLISASSIIRENGKKPCTIGLTSTQVTEVFYRGIHTMDTDLLLASAKNCREAQSYISKIPQIYVTTQMKSAYNFDSGISTPENWFFYEPDSTKSYSRYIYGITNFTIDEKPSSLNIKVPVKKHHPSRLFPETTEAKHTVRYYLVHNQDNQIEIEQFTTFVTLQFIDKSWTISSLEETKTSEIISPLTVSLDFKQKLKDFKGDIIKALNSIRIKYPWLPTEEALVIEKQRLDAIGY